MMKFRWKQHNAPVGRRALLPEGAQVRTCSECSQVTARPSTYKGGQHPIVRLLEVLGRQEQTGEGAPRVVRICPGVSSPNG